MRVALLGPNGQLGTDLRAAAGQFAGIELVPVDRSTLDVTDLEAVRSVLGQREFDALVNCTGFHKTDDVESDAQRGAAVNGHAVQAIAEVCAEKGARFLHVSTDYVFDGQTDRPSAEEDAPGPLNVYGATKLMGESLARAECDDTLIFRVASLFGTAGASGKGGNFVETMIRVGREKGKLTVIDDQVMSPTATADVAPLILGALDRELPAGTYHAVNSGQASWHEFARAIIERAGVEAAVEPIPSRDWPQNARRPAFSVLDNSKLTEALGPIPHWTDALDRYLARRR